MQLNFLNRLDADDIFVSYSREDGSAYLTGLDAALSKRGVSCFTDMGHREIKTTERYIRANRLTREVGIVQTVHKLATNEIRPPVPAAVND